MAPWCFLSLSYLSLSLYLSISFFLSFSLSLSLGLSLSLLPNLKARESVTDSPFTCQIYIHPTIYISEFSFYYMQWWLFMHSLQLLSLLVTFLSYRSILVLSPGLYHLSNTSKTVITKKFLVPYFTKIEKLSTKYASLNKLLYGKLYSIKHQI